MTKEIFEVCLKGLDEVREHEMGIYTFATGNRSNAFLRISPSSWMLSKKSGERTILEYSHERLSISVHKDKTLHVTVHRQLIEAGSKEFKSVGSYQVGMGISGWSPEMSSRIANTIKEFVG